MIHCGKLLHLTQIPNSVGSHDPDINRVVCFLLSLPELLLQLPVVASLATSGLALTYAVGLRCFRIHERVVSVYVQSRLGFGDQLTNFRLLL